MSDHSDSESQRELRDRVIGLGERSLRKSHYAALQRSLRELEEKDRLIRQAYSDVVAAITGGRLIILGKDELEAAIQTDAGPPVGLHEASELGAARHRLQAKFGDSSAADGMILAFCEAATNMLKHANGGEYRIAVSGDCAQIILSDQGTGIDFRHLPKATLMPGYSGAQSLGMGFTLMLELCDRLLLCTDRRGTTLVLEKDLSTAEKSEQFALADLGF